MKLSIIIPVYKDAVGLRDTLRSLSRQTLNKNEYEIIVINDGADKTIEKVCKKYSVRSKSIFPNKGSYNARNEGIKMSRGKYLAFVDADIEVSSDWLEKGYKLLKKYDYVGGQVQIDKRKLKTLAHYYEYLTGFNNEKYMERYHYCPTANLFVRKDVIHDVGGFDARLFSGGDMEFGNRVYESGKYKMFYSKELVVSHPPRGYRALVRKHVRITKGAMKLTVLYPERYSKKKKTIRSFLGRLLSPFFSVIESKREINFYKKIQVLIFALYLGFVNVFNIRKLKE